ncbi:hypothetical protein D3C86_2143570 [compost metagenome]
MLVVGGLDAAPPFLAVRGFGNAAIFDHRKRVEPGHTAFIAGIGARREQLGTIERANGEIDPIAGEVFIKERRAAFAAEAPINMV